MEPKIFETSPLNSMEFETVAHSRVLPDELPPPAEVRGLPRDILKSAAVENLLSQNEELMARLKVSLRRLNSIEAENQKLAQIAEETRRQAAQMEDQVFVLRENDILRKEQVEEDHQKFAVTTEKLKYYEERAHNLEQQIASQLDHSARYQERIRTQVKPHLIQLKEYARSLEEKAKELDQSNTRAHAQIRDLREQMIDVAKHAKYQTEQAEIRVMQITESYEATVKSLKEELTHARERAQAAEAKLATTSASLTDAMNRVRRAEQKAIEQGNEIVEIRRSREEIMNRADLENRRMAARCDEFGTENIRLKMENEEMRAKILSDFDKINEQDRKNFEQKSQLESLRFMYNSRAEELEKLKMTLVALERLNLDLSSRLQEQVQQPVSP